MSFTSFTSLLLAWGLSIAAYAGIIQVWYTARGEATSGVAKGIAEGFLGLGVLLAVPSFLFALIVAWPIMSWLATLRPAWLMLPVAPVALGSLMWLLATLMLPDGWRGAGQALVGYAAVLGLVWAIVSLANAAAR